MLRHIDSWGADTPPYTGPRTSRRGLLSVLIVTTMISGGLRSAPASTQEFLHAAAPASVTVSVGLEAIRTPAGARPRARPLPEASVEAFVDAWLAGDRVAAHRLAGRGVYRDLTRLANRYAIAEEAAGRASAVCSGGRTLFCRVYVPHILEVDARLAERHSRFVVLGFKLPAAG